MTARKIKKHFTFFFTFFYSLFLCKAAFAQNNYHYTIYSQEDGLASGTLRSIVKDSTGFLWLLSENGVSRFDGYTFKTFRHDASDTNSISSSDIMQMVVDKSGKILFRTDNSICSYNPQQGTFKNLISFHNNKEVKGLLCNANGFWVFKSSSLLNINPLDEKITPYSLPNDIQAISIQNEKDLIGSLWLRKNNSIINFNPKTKIFSIIPVQHLKTRNEDKGNFPLRYFSDINGATYFYSSDGLFKFSRQHQAFIQLTTSKIAADNSNPINGITQAGNYIVLSLRYDKVYTVNLFSGEEKTITLTGSSKVPQNQIAINGIFPTTKGYLWISTPDAGVYLFNPTTGKSEHLMHDEKNQNSLPANNFEFILEDKNVVWMSAPGIGLVKTEPLNPAFASYKPLKKATSKPFELYKNIRTIAELDKNTLLIGTLDGLNLFNKTTHAFQSVLSPVNGKPILQNAGISKIFIDTSNNIWISSWSQDGIFIINYKDKKFVTLKPNENPTISEYETARSMYLDSHGYLWLGTNADLIYRINTKTIDYLNAANNHFEKIKGIVTKTDTLIFNITFAIAENKKREILIGTQNGFYIYSYSTKKFKRFVSEPGNATTISDDNIRSFYIDKKGTTWIGTNGGGLNRFDEAKETFKAYKIENGLPDNSIYSILEDSHGNLWMGTNRGICRFNIAAESSRNYSLKDGIQNNEFNTKAACKLSTGEMVFGGINGFNIFNPDSIAVSSEIPKIVITQFKVGEKEKGVSNETLYLNHYENYLSFQFAALNFFRNNENKYAYKLEGLDKDWVYCGDRRFTNYANLSPGNYTFRVKAANYFGEWNENGAALKLNIATPWYNTLLFQFFVLLFLSAIVYAVFRYRLNQKLKLQDVRNRIASDLHDEIGSTLSSIALYSEVAHKIVKQKAPEANSMMTQISENTSAMMEALSDIVWTINTRNDRFDNIINRMNAYAVERMEPLNCKVKMESEENISFVKLNMEQRKNVYLIFKEAINNTAKYAHCQNLFISLSVNNKEFNMKVVDDGKGFKTVTTNNALSERGNGLQNMRKRAKELNGNISITSSPDNGTSIELKFQLKNH
jgi:signal transduction histidine kinase/ligand-binding sensor domain-containing protein